MDAQRDAAKQRRWFRGIVLVPAVAALGNVIRHYTRPDPVQVVVQTNDFKAFETDGNRSLEEIEKEAILVDFKRHWRKQE